MSSAVIMMQSGTMFDLIDVDPYLIDIYDIAHHLSLICRFTGATREHYSVAQHSLFVSLNVSPENAFAGLLHDAAEAYIGDVSRPLKKKLPEYKRIEENIWEAIAWKFNIDVDLPAEVLEANRRICDTEQMKFLPKPIMSYDRVMNPLPIRLEAMTANASRVSFLREYYRLIGDRKKRGKNNAKS